jgi:hypothetical protein
MGIFQSGNGLYSTGFVVFRKNICLCFPRLVGTLDNAPLAHRPVIEFGMENPDAVEFNQYYINGFVDNICIINYDLQITNYGGRRSIRNS